MQTNRWTSLTKTLTVAGMLLMAASYAQDGAAAMPEPGSTAAVEVERIENYLSDLDTLRAHFIQVDPSGGISTGNLYYEKPDKMRLDYDLPNPVLIVVNGWQALYHDRKLDQATHLLTSQTPLAFLFKKNVKLSGDVTVTDYKDSGDEFLVTIIQTEEPDLGFVELAFAKDPMALQRWTVTDGQGLVTQIILERSERDVAIDGRLFLLCDPDAVIKKEGCEY
jgi:outer membrane lipoprotein-sorting protein